MHLLIRQLVSTNIGNFLVVTQWTPPPPLPKVYKSPSTSATVPEELVKLYATPRSILHLGHNPPWLWYNARKLALFGKPTVTPLETVKIVSPFE